MTRALKFYKLFVLDTHVEELLMFLIFIFVLKIEFESRWESKTVNHLYFYIVRQLNAHWKKKKNWASWWALGMLPLLWRSFVIKVTSLCSSLVSLVGAECSHIWLLLVVQHMILFIASLWYFTQLVSRITISNKYAVTGYSCSIQYLSCSLLYLTFLFCWVSCNTQSWTFHVAVKKHYVSIKNREFWINLFPVYIFDKLIIHGFLRCWVQNVFSFCLCWSLKMKYSIHATWPLQGLINLLKISCSSHQNNTVLFLKSA